MIFSSKIYSRENPKYIGDNKNNYKGHC